MRLAGLEAGGEFKGAIEEAVAVRAQIVYGDVPVDVTTSRLAERVSLKV